MLNKSALIGTTLALIALPLIAQADLYTTNNTDKYSSAKLTAPSNPPYNCSGSAPNDVGITKPGEVNHLTLAKDVKGLCNLVVPCTANIIMESSHADAVSCTGVIVAKATIENFDTDVVTKIEPVAGSGYTVSGAGTNKITISKN